MNAKTTRRYEGLLRASTLSIVLALLMAVGVAATAGARTAYAADSQLAAQGLSAQAVTVVKSLDVTITPPKVGEKGTSDFINIAEGNVDKNTSIKLTTPSGANYYVQSYAFFNKDWEELTSPVTFKAGETYYLEVAFMGKDNVNFDISGESIKVLGGAVAKEPEVYNFAPEMHSGASVLFSFEIPQVKLPQVITATSKIVQAGKTVKLAAKTTGDGKLTYKSSSKAIATVNAKGVVTGKKAGKVAITITAAETDTHKAATKKVTVYVKKANTLALKVQKKVLKASALKKKAATFNASVIKTKGVGTLTYTKKSVTKKYNKYVTVSSKGKITVKKGAPKGKCVLVLNVKAKGNLTHLAITKTVKVTMTIK